MRQPAGADHAVHRRVALLLALLTVVVLVVVGTLVARLSRPGTPARAAGPTAPASSAPPSVSPWREVFRDDFDQPRLDPRRWFAYSGEPRDSAGGLWLPSHVQVDGGLLTIRGSRDAAQGGLFVTGGLNSSPGLRQAYGKYVVRLRVQAGTQVGYSVLLAGPSGGGATYVALATDDGGRRRTLTAGLRTRALSGAPVRIDRHTSVDLTTWHDVGVEWQPGELRFTLDGRTWGTVASALVPRDRLSLALQTQAICPPPRRGACDPAVPGPVDLQVDSVTAFTRIGG